MDYVPSLFWESTAVPLLNYLRCLSQEDLFHSWVFAYHGGDIGVRLFAVLVLLLNHLHEDRIDRKVCAHKARLCSHQIRDLHNRAVRVPFYRRFVHLTLQTTTAPPLPLALSLGESARCARKGG